MSVRGVVFDLDGVLTDTAALHFAAWRELFDGVLGNAAPFTLGDYRRYVDGRGRTEGVAGVLAARHVTLPEGEPADPPSARTVHGLAARKVRFRRGKSGHTRSSATAFFPQTKGI